jgi:H+-translocating diphosphatase
MESTALPVLAIGAAIISAFYLGQSSGLMHEGQPTGGLFGTAVATMGMLSTAVYVLAMDVFGPIADNAGGIDAHTHTHTHTHTHVLFSLSL